MAYNRRQQRRQGVRYGPPRTREGLSDNGVLIGRFLGLGILLLALGVLAAGALAFMGERPAASSTPRRSIPAIAVSPGGQSSATPAGPTPAPLIPTPSAAILSPTPVTATALPTPAASNVPPLVQIGEGYVTFGTRADDQLHILDPRSVFSIEERIVWSAYLTEPADSVALQIMIFKLDTAAIGGERMIAVLAVTPLVRDAQIFRSRIRPQAALEGPGVYAVRYVRGTDVLSEGFVEIIT